MKLVEKINEVANSNTELTKEPTDIVDAEMDGMEEKTAVVIRDGKKVRKTVKKRPVRKKILTAKQKAGVKKGVLKRKQKQASITRKRKKSIGKRTAGMKGVGPKFRVAAGYEDMKPAQKLLSMFEAKEPREIKSIWDNGGKTSDRYTFIFDDKWSGYDQHKKDGGVKKDIFMSLSTDDSGGRSFSQWSDSKEGKHLGTKIKWDDLDKVVQNHVLSRIKED